MSGALLVIGDTLLDRDLVGTVDRLSPDAPVPVVDEPVAIARPGGAGLAALLAAADGRPVTLLTALGADAAGRELAALLAEAGVEVIDLGLAGATPEKIRIRADGRSLLRLDRGGRPPVAGDISGPLPEVAAVLVADYGRGVAARPGIRAALAALAGALAVPSGARPAPAALSGVSHAAALSGPRRTPLVWDPHPRGAEPVAGATLVTPNAAEAAHFASGPYGASLAATTARATELLHRWAAVAVSVTLGARGALLVTGDGLPAVVPAPQVPCFDPCGAGDRYASAAAGLLADGALPSEAVAGAVVVASAFVAAGGAASVRVGSPAPHECPATADAAQVVARVRSAGGTVVATGGCFDLLHAGHVGLLEQARGLGDCLVVFLNSDDSVRRLKGVSRPLQTEQDRASVLLALGCVDAVVVFDEDTPVPALARWRPDVFAKGGDYALACIPEAQAMAGWGGQAVVLPYLTGRSTSDLLKKAVSRA